jgi:hypothetical protein
MRGVVGFMANGVSDELTHQHKTGITTMFQFSRQKIDGAQFAKPMTDRDLKTHKVYGAFLGNQSIANLTLTRHNTTVLMVIQVGRRCLGDAVWARLVELGGRETLNVAAEVIDDHLHQKDQYNNKDLQINLVLNVVKELATDDKHKAHYCAAAEELLRKVQLDTGFRREVEHALLNTGAIYQPFLVINRN